MTIETTPALGTGTATAPAAPAQGVRFSTAEIKRRIDAMFDDLSPAHSQHLEN